MGGGPRITLSGIFDDGATAIDAATDLPISEITEDTLDEIIFSFGGDEDTEDAAVLILNKDDLKEFAMLRDSNGRKIYDIKPGGNVGTIDGVPYILNSACKGDFRFRNRSGRLCDGIRPAVQLPADRVQPDGSQAF